MTAGRETAHAKLNLALHVRRRRGDGYHDIDTLFAFCADGDVVTAEPADMLTLAIDGPFAEGLSAGPDNLVLRAAALLREAAGIDRGAAIRLTKRLPVASGIGGGSADAAAALRLLVRLWRIDLPPARMGAIAASLGADVPACLLSRTSIGAARGDALAPIGDAGLAGVPALLVNPGVPVSTAAVFGRWDGIDRGGLAGGDPFTIASAGRNDLEAPARTIAPQVDEAMALLSQGPGVRLARMSGSGATCFALHVDAAARDAAAARIAAARPDWWRLETALL